MLIPHVEDLYLTKLLLILAGGKFIFDLLNPLDVGVDGNCDVFVDNFLDFDFHNNYADLFTQNKR